MNTDNASMRLLRALGEVDDKYIAEALDDPREMKLVKDSRDAGRRKKASRRRTRAFSIAGVIAAALVLVIIGAAVLRQRGWFVTGDSAVPESAVTGADDGASPEGLLDGDPEISEVTAEPEVDAAPDTGSVNDSSDDEGSYDSLPAASGSHQEDASGTDTVNDAYGEDAENAGTGRGEDDGYAEAAAEPFVTVADMAEAEAMTGFTAEVPETIGSYTERVISVEGAETINVRYFDPEGALGYTIRKEAGSGDISFYPEGSASEEVIELDGVPVTLRGDAEGWTFAAWESEGCSCALIISEGAMSTEEITGLVSGIS